MSNRRDFLSACCATGVAGLVVLHFRRADALGSPHPRRSEAQWRARLTPGQYEVLREGATEQAFTNELLHEHRSGIYACVGCGQQLFTSPTKFDSETGWPSFWASIDNAVTTSADSSHALVRTAVSCGRCGGHLGHVFADGPPPTGLRYCINGCVLAFVPVPFP